ncbi:MAG: hypothetical protein AAGB04_00405 [Pseudomonadota bacterium]
MFIVFDIETGPLSDTVLRTMLPPLKPEEPLGAFDPTSVRIGNLVNQQKIQQKLDREEAKHRQEVEKQKQRMATAADDHFANFKSRSALRAEHGRVMAIGRQSGDERTKEHLLQAYGDDLDFESEEQMDRAESMLLVSFWELAVLSSLEGITLAGHNINRFDLPFLVRRSWILDVPVPPEVRNGRYWSSVFVDTLDEWQLGDRSVQDCGLDSLCRATGGPCKPADVKGDDFARLYLGTESERMEALAYLDNDLAMTMHMAETVQLV